MGREPLLVGLDVGTSNIKAVVVEADGSVVATASCPTPTHHPQPGWAHYDPEEIWSAVVSVVRESIEKVDDAERVAGIAAASVGETGYPVDADGATTFQAIAWFDDRSKAQAEWLRDRIGSARTYETSRLTIKHIYGVCKILWLRENAPKAFERTRTWLNTADYVAFRLSGEKATDSSLASRTLLFDVEGGTWDNSMLDACGLSPDLLAPLQKSGTNIGRVLPSVAEETGLPRSAVVTTGGHDHVCGALGVGVVDPGTLLNSLGTAEALFLSTVEPLNNPTYGEQGYAVGAHVAWDRHYAIGGLFSSGGSVDWVSSLLGDIDRTDLLTRAADVEPGSRGVCFLPHLNISNPPYGDDPSRAAFVGLTGDVTKEVMYRAVLEGIALESRLCLDGLLDYAEVNLSEEIVTIGGSTRNDLLMEIKASVFGKPLVVPDVEEAVALGTALLAGLGSGVYSDVADAVSRTKVSSRVLEPDPELAEQYERLFEDVYRHVYPSLRDLNVRIEGIENRK